MRNSPVFPDEVLESLVRCWQEQMVGGQQKERGNGSVKLSQLLRVDVITVHMKACGREQSGVEGTESSIDGSKLVEACKTDRKSR